MPQTGVIGCQFHPGTGVKTLASQLLDTEKRPHDRCIHRLGGDIIKQQRWVNFIDQKMGAGLSPTKAYFGYTLIHEISVYCEDL